MNIRTKIGTCQYPRKFFLKRRPVRGFYASMNYRLNVQSETSEEPAMKTQSLLAAAALVVTATSCEMPSGDITDPHTWGNYFLDKYRDELVIDELEPGPTPLAEPHVVLLITGVTIPAEWFEPMQARLERDGFIPVVYEPPDLLSGDLFDNAQ